MCSRLSLAIGPWFVALYLLVSPGQGRERESAEEYAARRSRVREQIEAPLILFSYGGREEISPAETFRQEPNFYYLTGHEEPGAALLLVPQSEAAKSHALPSEVLFLPVRDPQRERWDGVRKGPADGDVHERTGFETVLSMADLRVELERAAKVFPRLSTLFPSGPISAIHSARPDDAHIGYWNHWLQQVVPGATFEDARSLLGRLRQVKSDSELRLLRVAIDRSLEAHREAQRALRPGLHEYEIASLMVYRFTRAGCERPGYSPIVGSGFNSTVLHYSENRRQMRAGDVVVIDVGAECAGYTADITRTLPVSGKFTSRQKEIYEIVLGAQNAAIAAVKPGMTLARTGENSLYRIAYDLINSHGKDSNGEPLGKYFIHGLGHHIGLDVHDAGDSSRPLEPGMVITIEPGIYIPEEELGVRIEDIVLVTKDGSELLTASLPRTVAEIERAMAEAQK